MAIRWRVLALLFLVRTTMAFQFQAVGALSPFMREAWGVSIADIGLLVGLYFAPGLALSLPGGALGRRYGDKPVVLVGLGLMAAGAAMMAATNDWLTIAAGRTLAGVGGILINVLMSKMVADWFSGREIAFSMALFINSWPVGIALALLTLPLIAGEAGLTAALLLTLGLVAAGFFGMALTYRPPEGATGAAAPGAGRVRGALLVAVLAAGLIWGLYNGALTIVFSFGPELLASRGESVEAAASLTSIVLWMLVAGATIASYLSDRLRLRDSVLISGVVLFAAMLWIGGGMREALPMVIAIGLVIGLPAGVIMSLPAAVLPPEGRSIGMGLFFTMHYLCGLAAPPLAGWAAEATGDLFATFIVGVGALLLCLPLLAVFRWCEARLAPRAVAV